MATTQTEQNKQEKQQQAANNAFEDFFDCSEIDNQDYSQFINDQSQLIIAQNGEDYENDQNNNQQQQQVDIEDQDIRIDVNNIVAMIKQEDIEEEQRKRQQELGEADEQRRMQYQQQEQEVRGQEDNQKSSIIPNYMNAQKQNQNVNSARVKKEKKTKEQMLIEPLPIFDCMYCVQNSQLVFQKVSEQCLHRKYEIIMNKLDNKYAKKHEDDQFHLIKGEIVEQILHTKFQNNLQIQDRPDDQVRYLQDTINLEVMISCLPLNYLVQYSQNSIANLSPVNGKSMMTLQTNMTQFIPFPHVVLSSDILNKHGVALKNKLSSLILYQRFKQNQSQAIYDNKNFLTSPTLIGGHGDYQQNSQINTQFFNTMGNHINPKNLRNNMVMEDFILEENHHFEGNVTLERWARTQRQKILLKISFESETHNIYDPKFSSEEKSIERSLSSIERSIYQDGLPFHNEQSEEAFQSSSSSPSVAEERDTISVTPNAITPNLSRIMNICSISKIEQPSEITAESGLTPIPHKVPKSSLSYNKTRPKRVYAFQSNMMARHQLSNNSLAESIYIQEYQGRFKHSGHTQMKENQRLHLSQVSPGESMAVATLLRNSQGRNVSNIINSLNNPNILENNTNNYKTEPNDSIMMTFFGSALNTGGIGFGQNGGIPYQDYLNPSRQSPTGKRPIKVKTSSTGMMKNKKKQKERINLGEKHQQKSKLTIESLNLQRNNSNQYLQFEQSSIMNPYETVYNSPSHNVNFMDKSTTVGGENRNSLMTTGATELKLLQEQNRSTLGKKSAASQLRNSQSMSNLNLQPRAFITRNVKIRKNINQSTFGVMPGIGGQNFPSTSEFLTTPQNNLISKRNIDDKMSQEMKITNINSTVNQQTSQSTMGLLSNKKDQTLQIKRQRLARDILLSKVYNSNQQQLVINTHKKTNTTVSSSMNNQYSTNALAKMGSVKHSQQLLKSNIKKSTLKLDSNYNIASSQDMNNKAGPSNYFNRNSESKHFIRQIAQTVTKNGTVLNQQSVSSLYQSNLPTINNFLKLVKKVGEQQKDLILEFSQQLNQHNELIEKALEKQERMENKLNRIESKLMEKEIYHYQQIQDKLEQKRQQDLLKKQERDFQRKQSGQNELLLQQKDDGQDAQYENGDIDDDGFASCEEDENGKKSGKNQITIEEEEKTGDYIKDHYLALKNVHNKEDKSKYYLIIFLEYIRQGKQAMFELFDLLKPETWTFEKTHAQCDIYRRDNHQNMVVFRVETKFDYPPELVFEFHRQIELRMIWDGQNYELLKPVRLFEMDTSIYHVQLKKQWPLGNRELLLVFQGIQVPEGDIYLISKSTKHEDYPESDKCLRVNTKAGCYHFQPLNNRKTTRFIYMTEFDFKGSMPRYMVQKAAQASFVDSITKLRKLLDKLHIDKKYNPDQ